MRPRQTFEDPGARRRPWAAAVVIAVVLAGLAVVLMPGVLALPEAGLGALTYAVPLVLNPCVLGALVLSTFALVRGWRAPTVAVLEPDHLRVPANGTRGVFAMQMEPGYRYSPKKGVLTVHVPYDRITEVRRASEAEADSLGRRGLHYTLSVNRRVRSVRGRTLDEAGGPVLIDEELRGCWVSDPARAVAIRISHLPHQSAVWPMLPEALHDVTLYVSVEDPDALVDALREARDVS